MDTRQLEMFVRVAQLCSFSKAAEAMDISQSVLSRQVSRLEREIGKHLLYRNGRGVIPTETGKRFLARSAGILRQLQDAKQEAHEDPNSPTGSVVVGLPPRIGSSLTGPLVAEFSRKFPQATISVVEGPTASIYDWLILGRLDLGLLNNPQRTPHLQYESMKSEQLHLVGATAQRKRLPKTMRLQRIGLFPLILPCRPHAMRNLIDDECSTHGIRLNVVLEIDPIVGIIDLVARGFGYSILAASTIPRDARNATFESARIVSPAITNHLFSATPTNRPPSHLVRVTSELIKAELKKIG